MKQFIKQTDEVVKWNLRQLVVFELMYRLVAGAFYIRLVNRLLGFSLNMAGYSYLTVGNMGAFLLRPVTIVCVLISLAVLGVIFLVETGCLLTCYQAAAYSRRLDVIAVLKGGLEKVWDQWKWRDWQLLPMCLVNYFLMSSYLLAMVLTRIKPVNFVMYEIFHSPTARLVLAVILTALVFIGIPSMLVFFACMVEQKRFRDGMRRSRQLLKGRWPAAVGLLVAVNVVVILLLLAAYLAIVVISAILVIVFVDSYAAEAVLVAVCSRLELALFFVGAFLVVIVDFGALTVVYFQFDRRNIHEPDWEFGLPHITLLKRKWVLLSTLALTVASTFVMVDLVRNGASMDWAPLGQTEITAHRGSLRRAPENTLVALETAIDEMADYSEIDVQTTADGVVVLFHDENVKRMAGVNRRLRDMTWEEVQRLDVGSLMAGRFAGEGIPALEQVLEACKGRMNLNIELKDEGNDTALPELVVAMVQEFEMEEQCVISSVKLRYLERVKELCPKLKTGYILAAAYGNVYENDVIDFISIRSSFVNRRLVEACHERGKAIHVWTVNSETELEQMKLLNVDNIITDYPTRAREVLYRERGTKNLLKYVRMMLR